MRTLLAVVLLWPALARADWPTDVVISGMGADADAAYRAIVGDLGAAVASSPHLPAATTGAAGFDVALGNTFVFIDAYDKCIVVPEFPSDCGPTAWQRAHPDGRPAPYLFVPTLTARKGLPWSFEVGATGGWVGGSNQGVFGGFVRYAPLESYKPYPDLSFQLGYSGYLGNDELDVGVLDLGVTLGSTFPMHRIEEGVTYSRWAPYVRVDLLRVTARHRLSEELAAELGLPDELSLIHTRVAAGFQVTTGRTLLRLGAAWIPQSVPTLHLSMGFAP